MRRRGHNLLIGFCALLCIALPFSAQQPPTNDPALLTHADAQQRAHWAEDWLRSGDPRKVAWGAWIARRDNLTILTPELVEKVKEYEPNSDLAASDDSASPSVERDRHDSLLAVLDALITLNESLPAAESRTLYPEFAAQSVFFMLRARNAPDLLEIFKSARANAIWLAVGNQLFRVHAPGFGAVLLSRVAQHLTLSVVDPHTGSGGGGGVGSGDCGPSLGSSRQGWPSVGLYFVTQSPETSGLPAILLSGGETPVYYLRAQGGYSNPPDAPDPCGEGDRDQYRAQYLNKALEFRSGHLIFDAYPQIIVEWHSEADYRAQLLKTIEDRRTMVHRAANYLQEPGGLLSPAEAAALKPRLEVIISDNRTNRSVPLPSVLQSKEDTSIVNTFTKPLN